MFYTIYKITNKVNGKHYTGMHKTDNLDDGYMGSGKLIKRAIRKYGIENFVKEILHIFDNEEDMRNKEKELVILDEMSYNLCEGGKGGFGYIVRNGLNIKGLYKSGEIHSKRWKEDQSYRENILNNCLTNRGVVTENFRYDWTGKTHKPETIKKMKESAVGKHIGEKNSQFGTMWITNGIENKKIKKEELDKWTSLGYNKGRIMAV